MSLIPLAGYPDLVKMFTKRRMPQSERFRTYFGRPLDVDRIETCIRQADDGYMVDFTDLCGEVLGLDPHLSAVLAKRFGAISSLDWEVLPAKGPDVDMKAAKEAADLVRQMLRGIPFFSERLYDLLWANYDGRAILEIHWRMQRGRYRWRPVELVWVHPRTISFGPRFELRIVDPWRSFGDFRADGIAPDEIPGKFLWWSPRLFREYPQREGLSPRTLYWSFFKRFSMRHRMILTEVFGLPWRIVTHEGEEGIGNVQQPDFDDAIETVENLGLESAVAGLPAGLKLDVVPPHPESGNMFQMTQEDVNAEMSKLVLWQTGTTDAVANRAETIVHKGEQNIVAIMDASGASGRVTERLVKPIVALNMGQDMVVNAPEFRLKADPPRDRAKEQELADKTITVGVPVAVKQYREITGMEEPEEGEPYIVAETPGNDPMTGAPLPPQPKIVDPAKTQASEGGLIEPVQERGTYEDLAAALPAMPQIPLTPTDIATIVSVNAALASLGLPPLQKPDGSLDPRGLLTIAEFQAENAAKIAQAAAAVSGKEGPSDGAGETAAAPPSPAASKPSPDEDETLEEQGLDGAKDRAEADLLVRTRGGSTIAVRRRTVLAVLSMAGLRPAGAPMQAQQRDAYSTSITNEQNHGHVLAIPARDLVEPGGPKQYNIKGIADHGHVIMLSSEQLLSVGRGEPVTTEATPGGEPVHTHQVTIARAVRAERRPTTLPFGGFEDFEDCVRTVKAGDPSLSDEAARRICGTLQAKEEQRADMCMAELLELARQERAGHDGCGGCEHDEE